MKQKQNTLLAHKGAISAQLAQSIDASRKENWLNPIAMSQLQKAVKAKQDTVSLGDKTYNIKYGVIFKSKVTGAKEECVHLTPTRGLVPRGYISLKRIKNFKFEDGE